MRRFFGYAAPEQAHPSTNQKHSSDYSTSRHYADDSQPDHILVKHGKQFLRVDFSSPGDIAKGHATVGDVRATTARFLGRGKDDITLVFGGKKLLNDKEKLVNLKIASGARVLAIVSKHWKASEAMGVPPKKAAVPADPIERIDNVLNAAAAELVPKIDQFVTSSPADSSDKSDKHRILSELILQRLFALDEIDTHENPEARRRRKEAVNKLHEYQARIDAAMSTADTSETSLSSF
ncbi:BAG domain-containing protein [Lipomyces doorenjongii]|uniref:BAG domain-containing protein n=1 Tax=Lipomyces doorenjongii TaxID=383834 RepID=UPI0034CF659E